MGLVIVGKVGCANCEKAKNICHAKKIPYEYKKVHEGIQIEELEQIAGGRVSSVPQIYVSEQGLNTYIGGFKEFEAYIQDKGPTEAWEVL